MYFLSVQIFFPFVALVSLWFSLKVLFHGSCNSTVGMLPLVLFPGAGSEIYRGLGSVVVGGLSLSAIMTLAIVPPLLGLFVGVLEKRRSETTLDSETVSRPAA